MTGIRSFIILLLSRLNMEADDLCVVIMVVVITVLRGGGCVSLMDAIYRVRR